MPSAIEIYRNKTLKYVIANKDNRGFTAKVKYFCSIACKINLCFEYSLCIFVVGKYNLFSKYFIMETVVVQINNSKAYKFLENLEDLQVIKVLKKSRQPKQKLSEKSMQKNSDSERTKRLQEIQSITKDIYIDLSNFHFNRNAANDYD